MRNVQIVVRRRQITTLVMVVAMIVLSSCGEPASPSRSEGHDGEAARSATPVADGFVYSCDGESHFDPATFTPGTAEEEPGPVGDALRELLDSESEWGIMPPTGWVEVRRTARTASFVAKDEGRFLSILIRKEGQGWDASGWGECIHPEADVGDASIIRWALDPDHPAPEPGDTEIHAVVSEMACSSASDPRERIREPIVQVTEDSINLVLTADPLRGFQTCPGSPALPYTIELDEPLGDRELRDAGLWPPKPADRELDW